MLVELEKFGIKRDLSVMTFSKKNPLTSFESEKIIDVARKICESGYRRIPIVNSKNKLVGIVTYTDILDAFLRNEDLRQKISTIMVREVISCNFEDTIGFVVRKMKFSRRGGLPVLKNDKVIGIITERDIINNLVFIDFGIKVKDVMTKKPFFLSKHLSILDVTKTLVSTKYRRFPVTEEEKVIGIITAADVLKYVVENDFRIEALDEDMEKIMRKNVFKILEEEDLSKAIIEMKEKNVGGLVVVDEKDLLKGIITERNIIEILV